MTVHRLKQDVVFNGEVISTLRFIACPDVAPNTVEMHQEVFAWSPAIYRYMKQVWVDVKKSLYENGTKKIVLVCPEDYGTKPPKYWKMFGFPEANIREVYGHRFWYTELELKEE